MTHWKEIKDKRMKYERSNPQTYAFTENGWDSDAYRRGWDEIFGKKPKGDASKEDAGRADESDGDGGDSGEAEGK